MFERIAFECNDLAPAGRPNRAVRFVESRELEAQVDEDADDEAHEEDVGGGFGRGDGVGREEGDREGRTDDDGFDEELHVV
ncbi:MAG: hypothetical protein ACO27L_03570 [Schleiferiaceae bacterium]